MSSTITSGGHTRGPSPARRAPLFKRLLLTLGWLSVAAWLVALPAPAFYWSEMLTHLTFQATLASLAVLALTLAVYWNDGRGWPLGPTLATLVHGSTTLVVAAPVGCPVPAADAPFLKLMVLNKHYANSDFDPIARAIREADPDLVALLEVSEADVSQLTRLADTWPERATYGRDDAFGLALISKLPITGEVLAQPDDRAGLAPYLGLFTVDWGGAQLRVAVAHPAPPLNATLHGDQGTYFQAISDWVGAPDPLAEPPAEGEPQPEEIGPTVVMGDLNTTPYAGRYSVLLRDTGLDSVACAGGLMPTWPADLPWVARLPLNDILVSDHLAPVAAGVGDPVGSDHLPVIATVQPTGTPEDWGLEAWPPAPGSE